MYLESTPFLTIEESSSDSEQLTKFKSAEEDELERERYQAPKMASTKCSEPEPIHGISEDQGASTL